MRAAVFVGAGRPLSIEEVDLGNLGPREVLVRTAAVGVCGCDQHALGGEQVFAAPAIFGYEAAGVVEAHGAEVATLRLRDRVVACSAVSCGRRAQCISGRLQRGAG
jgi:S-(hydroxymethyl)glutathione dehydrogenase/alcohol dehydrogenase